MSTSTDRPLDHPLTDRPPQPSGTSSPKVQLRPWGAFEVLADNGMHKVKELRIKPGHRISRQRHRHRSEHWYVVSGVAEVMVGDATSTLIEGDSIEIDILAWHRLANPGMKDLVVVEVQTGIELREEDIERAEDDYGRV